VKSWTRITVINRLTVLLLGMAILSIGAGIVLTLVQGFSRLSGFLIASGGITLPVVIGVWLGSRPADALTLDLLGWTWLTQEPNHYRVRAEIIATNANPTLEVTLAEVNPLLRLLSQGSLTGVEVQWHLVGEHAPTRRDNYWPAVILSPRSQMKLSLEIDITVGSRAMAWFKSSRAESQSPNSIHTKARLAWATPRAGLRRMA